VHFHLPKPLHGWRELLGEVGIIVIGVLIALGAEQVVEALHNRSVAEETRRAIKSEFNDDLAALAVRASIEPCIDRRLDELRDLFAEWERTGRFTRPQWVAQTPAVDIKLTRYDAAQAAGRLALLPSEEQFRMGAVANGLRGFDSIQRDEGEVWGRLRALQAGSDALSIGDRPLLRIALQDASTLDYRAKLSARQQLPLAREFGYQPDFTQFNAARGRVLRGRGYHPSICTAIDTPPAEANRNQVVPLPL
jgi:hypothetical protein